MFESKEFKSVAGVLVVLFIAYYTTGIYKHLKEIEKLK
jgi:hypothetical protein